MRLSEENWRKRLTPEQYRVLREEGTEQAFSGSFHNNKREGIYKCAGCGTPLFSSMAKYDSGTGWPSFFEPLSKDLIGIKQDFKLSSPRNEIHCKRCGGHLGHLFSDGPKPTGMRYCLNSTALTFEVKK